VLLDASTSVSNDANLIHSPLRFISVVCELPSPNLEVVFAEDSDVVVAACFHKVLSFDSFAEKPSRDCASRHHVILQILSFLRLIAAQGTSHALWRMIDEHIQHLIKLATRVESAPDADGEAVSLLSILQTFHCR
jgi:hypothetical protein